MEEASLEAALERGWPVRGPTICHPTFKMKIEQIQQDCQTFADVATTAVKEEAQVCIYNQPVLHCSSSSDIVGTRNVIAFL